MHIDIRIICYYIDIIVCSTIYYINVIRYTYEYTSISIERTLVLQKPLGFQITLGRCFSHQKQGVVCASMNLLKSISVVPVPMPKSQKIPSTKSHKRCKMPQKTSKWNIFCWDFKLQWRRQLQESNLIRLACIIHIYIYMAVASANHSQLSWMTWVCRYALEASWCRSPTIIYRSN